MEYKWVKLKLTNGDIFEFNDVRVDAFGGYKAFSFGDIRHCVRTDSIIWFVTK